MQIILEHRDYKIRIRLVQFPGSKETHQHYCSYVSHPDFAKLKENMEGAYNITYHEGDTIGWDTAHGYNFTMSMAEKFVDAIAQAVAFLEKR